jgi:GDP/UDP-N,N'-diacetylbacillosamine 2-epimerase (hydrolysing)
MGQEYRNLFFELEKEFPDRFTLIESFGRENYYASMKASEFLLGNTSSGIIEAASVGKYVINVGNRQEGRSRSENVIDIGFDLDQLHDAITKVSSLGQYEGSNVYKKKNTAQTIITKVKSHHERL